MSASDKKKLRKEEAVAKLTERQAAEQNEAKKLKLYTTIFAVVVGVAADSLPPQAARDNSRHRTVNSVMHRFNIEIPSFKNFDAPTL